MQKPKKSLCVWVHTFDGQQGACRKDLAGGTHDHSKEGGQTDVNQNGERGYIFTQSGEVDLDFAGTYSFLAIFKTRNQYQSSRHPAAVIQV